MSGADSTTKSSLNPASIIQWDIGRQRTAMLSMPAGSLNASSAPSNNALCPSYCTSTDQRGENRHSAANPANHSARRC